MLLCNFNTFSNVTLQSHDERDNKFLKIKLANVHGWWKIMYKDEWTPHSINKLGLK